MQIKKIDKTPPEMTGDVKKDIKALHDYMTYLRERVNFALNTIEKQEGDTNGVE
ncbi:MAG: hypothetical protein IKY46_08695 [Clostridia bacterium]|nr:hypothetical protein [Clostridia bacterium]MBR5903450.1 hypothetical protein [Clostridia bacterium]